MKTLLLMLMIISLNAQAKRLPDPKQFVDLSGVYACTGKDAHEGAYTGTVTMTLKPEHSQGRNSSYDFKLDVPGYGTYLGHAAAIGYTAAMHFALKDQSTKDYGTGVAHFKQNARGQLSFEKFYFEPEFKGGNTGTEHCVRQSLNAR